MKKIDENYFIKKDKVNFEPTIEESLYENETILRKGKPKKNSYIWNSILKFLPFALIWLVFDGFMIGMMCSFTEGIPLPLLIFLIFFFIFHLLPVWIWISNIVTVSKRLKIEEYAFTEQRIIIKRGFIGANIVSINYSSLVSVNLRIGLIERICKVGDIYLVSDDKQKNVLEDISDPYFIYNKLQKIANDIKADILYPNNLRPQENKGYKTSYKGDANFKDKK